MMNDFISFEFSSDNGFHHVSMVLIGCISVVAILAYHWFLIIGDVYTMLLLKTAHHISASTEEFGNSI